MTLLLFILVCVCLLIIGASTAPSPQGWLILGLATAALVLHLIHR